MAALFSEAMTGTTRVVDEAVLSTHSFKPFTLAVDIGGSQGSLLRGVLGKNPEARGIIYDLPDVTELARPAWENSPEGKRIEARSGDFFNNAAIVAESLQRHAPTHVVLDPVMVATSGAKLLEDDALHALRTRLLPLASIVTPNIPEAALLVGHAIVADDDAQRAIDALQALGARAVLLKGGHLLEGGDVIDRYRDAEGAVELVHERLALEGHGTGCTLASAIAANLCLGLSMPAAVAAASDYIARALRTGYRPGRGAIVVLDHFGAAQGAPR